MQHKKNRSNTSPGSLSKNAGGIGVHESLFCWIPFCNNWVQGQPFTPHRAGVVPIAFHRRSAPAALVIRYPSQMPRT